MRDLAVLRSLAAAAGTSFQSFLPLLRRPAVTGSLLAGLLAATVFACAGDGREGFQAGMDGGSVDPNTKDDDDSGTGGFDNTPSPDAGPREINEIFGHSAKVLYRLDPKTNDVQEVGPFSGCADIIDLALDAKGAMYAVANEALYTVDKTSAACTKIADGKNLPNSLSFVPQGTVDGASEALVGFDDADYVRIDITTGVKTKIGSLAAGALISSGDIASVKDGATYLTVKPKDRKSKSCTNDSQCKKCVEFDCLVEIDPSTGRMLKNWGPIEHTQVFGLSFWGGKVYGFDNSGQLFDVTFGSSQTITKTIPIPSKPADLSFWGAGSSTSVPLVAPPS